MIGPAFWNFCLPQSTLKASALPRCNRFSLHPSLSIFAGVLCFALLAASTAPPSRAQATEPGVSLAGHVPAQILEGHTTLLSHYSPQQKLRLTLAIKPPHLAEEEAFLRELTDRKSPSFHAFLTPEEWNARFAPSEEDEQAVVDWAQSRGMTVTRRFNHRLLVDLEAPAGIIEKAFGVTINSYRYRDEIDFSNDRDPVLPARLAGIVYSVQGLNNIQRDHGSRPGPQAKAADYAEGPAYAPMAEDHADAYSSVRPAANEVTSNSTLLTNGSLNPTGVYNSQVYNYDGLQNLGHCCNPHNDSGGTPNVSNIAIAAFGNINGSDVVGFQANYPYLAYDWNTYTVDGSINCTTNPGACPSGETTQDVEWTIATANSFGSYLDTSHIYVYIGGNYNNGTFTDMYGDMLHDNTARVFTTSWSCTEIYGCSSSTMDARHSIFNSMIGQGGWTIIAASGDRGSADDCNFNNPAHESAAYPGSDYDVLAAGGTQLQVYSDGSWDYEHGWQGGTFSGACSENDGGSGGGVSSYYARQGWQSNKSGSFRWTPDISLNALGIGQNLYIGGSLQCCANGTSIVAPELAGFFAQENAYLNYIGHVCGSGGTASCTPVGNPMPWFYAAAITNDTAHTPFYDMTVGCNNNDVTAADGLGYYCSGVGYDDVTGWGSANMLQLAWAINWQLIPANGTPSVTFKGPATGQWYNTSQTVSWTINDYGGGTYPGTGIAGFTQGWDSIAPDSTSKPHGGTNDTYYWGPQYANATKGCLSFVNGSNGCAGGVSQGCHTAHVRGWNNQGWTTGNATYGPICYDYTPPITGISIATGPRRARTASYPVTITLTATDTYSGVAGTYYYIYFSDRRPTQYGYYIGPINLLMDGSATIYAYSWDHAGNFENYRIASF